MSNIDFDLYFEYINDQDEANDRAAARRRRKELEELQAKLYYRVISRLIQLANIKGLFSWL